MRQYFTRKSQFSLVMSVPTSPTMINRHLARVMITFILWQRKIVQTNAQLRGEYRPLWIVRPTYPCITDKAQPLIGAYGWNDHDWSLLALENFRGAHGDVVESMLPACTGKEFALQTIWSNNSDVRLLDGPFAVLTVGGKQLSDVAHDHIHFNMIVKTV